MQNAHLRECLSSAHVREDTALVIAIQKILHAESIHRHWQSIQWAANSTRVAQSLGSQCLIQ
jgi:hypothetical protein